MLSEGKMFLEYLWALPKYFRSTISEEDCQKAIAQQMQKKKESFLTILEKGIFQNPSSPYRKLFEHYKISFADVQQMLQNQGIDETLTQLYEKGIFITLDEFKGRQPIIRDGLHIKVEANDFDNPLLEQHFVTGGKGSRSQARRNRIDLKLLTHESAYYYYYLNSFDLKERPIANWRPVPPAAAGIKLVLRYAKLGKKVERWFTQTKFTSWKYYLFTKLSVWISRWSGTALPSPEHVPIENALEVAKWLAAKKEQGQPGILDSPCSCIVRVCLAAEEHGLDISGSFFRLGGEPFTESKNKIIEKSGCTAVCHYSITEVGNLGIACKNREHLDEVHLLTDKVAVLQFPKKVDQITINAIYYTTLMSYCPKLMINVECDDYGVIVKRKCDCRFEQLGFNSHLHTIRSYEKLSSEGMSFLGTELILLIEEVLPSKFGGNATDYQLMEKEIDGITKVFLIIHPSVNIVDEKQVVQAMIEFLSSFPGGDLMADIWRQGKTLQILRQEPYLTSTAKVLTLHIDKSSS